MKEVLIVVDYQKDFVDGALGFAGAEALDGPIARRIAEVRAGGGDVIFTMDTHGADYLSTMEGRKLPVVHCVKDTAGWQLYGQVGAALRPGDPVFEKETFPSLDLADWLRERDYGAVELCGLVSHICVLSNAVMVKAALPNAAVTVDASYHFLKSAAVGDTLRAESAEVRAGRSIGVYDVRITKQDGTLLGTGTFTFYRLDQEIPL